MEIEQTGRIMPAVNTDYTEAHNLNSHLQCYYKRGYFTNYDRVISRNNIC